nr:hypothetical protein [bacterium]
MKRKLRAVLFVGISAIVAFGLGYGGTRLAAHLTRSLKHDAPLVSPSSTPDGTPPPETPGIDTRWPKPVELTGEQPYTVVVSRGIQAALVYKKDADGQYTLLERKMPCSVSRDNAVMPEGR